MHGFQLFDKVKYKEQECFIFGRRSSGYFDLRKLDGTKIHASANNKKLKLLEKAKTILRERRKGNSSPHLRYRLEVGYPCPGFDELL